MELFLLHVLLFLVKCAHILLISLQHFIVSHWHRTCPMLGLIHKSITPTSSKLKQHQVTYVEGLVGYCNDFWWISLTYL